MIRLRCFASSTVKSLLMDWMCDEKKRSDWRLAGLIVGVKKARSCRLGVEVRAPLGMFCLRCQLNLQGIIGYTRA